MWEPLGRVVAKLKRAVRREERNREGENPIDSEGQRRRQRWASKFLARMKRSRQQGGLQASVPGQNPAPAPIKAILNPAPPSETERFSVFHRFTDLPRELRLKIWTASVPGQIIHINYAPKRKNSYGYKGPNWILNGKYGYQWKLAHGMSSPPIRTLLACKEANYEISRQYTFISLVRDGNERRIYNPNKDVLFFNTDTQTTDRVRPPSAEFPITGELERVRTFAISDVLWDLWPFVATHCGSQRGTRAAARERWKSELIERLPNANKVLLVMNGETLDVKRGTNLCFETYLQANFNSRIVNETVLWFNRVNRNVEAERVNVAKRRSE